MTQLFVQLTSTVTGNVITIVAFEIVAAIIGFIIAWYYARSVYTPIIKGLETDKASLNQKAASLTGELGRLEEKVSKLSEKIDKLESDKAEKDKEIKALSAKPANIGKYVTGISKNGDYYFNLKAGNGQTILSSEMYTTKAACTNGIESVMKNCDDDRRYERKVSTNNKPFFNLKAANGQVIGTSEMYESDAGMENGIASVKRNGISTNIVEEDFQ
jgi:uncharacterized protein